jgi:predicted membrane protein
VQKFSAPMHRTLEYVLGISLTFQLFYAESNFALMIGGLLLTFIAVALILKAISFGTRPAAAGAS